MGSISQEIGKINIFLLVCLIFSVGYNINLNMRYDEATATFNQVVNETAFMIIEKQEKIIEQQNERIKLLEEALAMYNNIAVDNKLKTPKPRWSITILEFPDKVKPGGEYNITYEVRNLLPIKDSIKVVGYFFHVDSYKYDDNLTTQIFIPSNTVVLEGHGKKIIKGKLKVPENFIPGDYILTGAVTYYDVNPVEFIDRRQVEVSS